MQDLKDIRIIFSDIDGTLLPFEGKDLAPTAALIGRLMEAGYTFIPCTGRGTGNIPREIKEIPGIRYVITANGALVTDLESGEVLYERRLTRSLARQVTDFLRPYNGLTYAYRRGQHYLDVRAGQSLPQSDKPSLQAWLKAVVPMDFDIFLEEEDSAWLDKMGFSTYDQTARRQVREDIQSLACYPELFVCTSGFWNVEVNAAGANKGAAALWLAEKLGFGRHQILAAGDNINDIPLLETAAVSLAPANAEPEVKAVATFQVADCKENGVENFLKQLLA